MPVAYLVGASDYGGPGDPTSGTKGYKGDNLENKMAFAELYMGSALGNLPYKQKLLITYGGKSVIAEKLDIGLGGAPVSGHARRIDLWYQTAQALGFNGTGLVKIQRLDGGPILGPGAAIHGKNEHEALETEVVPGSGLFPADTNELKKAAEKAANDLKKPLQWGEDLAKILSFLGSGSSWARIGKVVIGGGILLIAIDQLTKIGPGPSTDLAGGTAKAGKAGIAKSMAKFAVEEPIK